ncbi:hypothetical protein TVAG_373680 [Trichomonas vaginalis G3]|uniref:Uncharacterized protein n=1 Tax=Trichomonas vaginalis (strain ATCC PRA-98 / G3) TaxID=412133 RepID=A2FQQ9_TRIV3|nr:hypothetical protein TVAGG3_0833340 [Trichomonas vaginalis G3]EAX92768.1 hypothetical protein TVAG_373680 [Trichomonas vaginalis G3]KAI5498738.1 hypothetical protein TVAGG3_0833340 [Trichomonas vaginalis G3]|eukprot:XP_001305698.1 hypothetical protein [Trichomonas vaginalis G3]
MEEVSSTSSLPDSSFQSSIDNKIEKLLDIPFHTKVANNLKSLYSFDRE